MALKFLGRESEQIVKFENLLSNLLTSKNETIAQLSLYLLEEITDWIYFIIF